MTSDVLTEVLGLGWRIVGATRAERAGIESHGIDSPRLLAYHFTSPLATPSHFHPVRKD
jgi:hypothetical protein